MEPTGPDEIDGVLADDLRARVKSELVPGERLLWAARAYNRHDHVSGAFLTWALMAVVLAVVGVLSWAKIVHNPLRQIEGFLFLGLCLGVVDFFIVLGLVLNWRFKRSERARLANTCYALTDRRAIVWSPEGGSGAVKVVTVPRGSVSGVYRVEYPDGSGNVIFKAGGDGPEYVELPWGPTGFLGVAEVRRVEEQVRRTLVIPLASLSGSDGRSNQKRNHPTGGSV